MAQCIGGLSEDSVDIEQNILWCILFCFFLSEVAFAQKFESSGSYVAGWLNQKLSDFFKDVIGNLLITKSFQILLVVEGDGEVKLVL